MSRRGAAGVRARLSVPLFRRGDLVPWFEGATLDGAPDYRFNTVAGRHILLLFFGSARHGRAARALQAVQGNRDLLDDRQAAFFGLTSDPTDVEAGRIAKQVPGIRFFLDFDRRLASMFGAFQASQYVPHWLLLDPELRVLDSYPIDQAERAFADLRHRVGLPRDQGMAPVLQIPDVLDPEVCTALIRLYETQGGRESGFMSEKDGRTVGMLDPHKKRRKDCEIGEGPLREALRSQLQRRLAPAIQRAFQFEATRIERYIVACYAAGHGHFRAHRDNTTRGTAHRKFAVTINLNADDYDGGDLCFPEFGTRTYRAPTGGAVVFSCSLLHEAQPVTRGQRYAFLPFLYDDDGARIREENARFVDYLTATPTG